MKNGYSAAVEAARLKTERALQLAINVLILIAIVCTGALFWCFGEYLAERAEKRAAVSPITQTAETTETIEMLEAVPAPLVVEVQPISLGGTINTGCDGTIDRTNLAGSGECQYTYYDVPLSDEVQEAIFDECAKHGIDPTIIFGMCFRESCFNANAIGDNGHAFGLMQIQERYHADRMARLGVRDLLDPAQNVTVGIDFMAELIEKYGDVEKALVCYNYGEYGAKVHCFDKGIASTAYSRAVLEYAARWGVR